MGPHLKEGEKLRILYFFAEAFRREPGLSLTRAAEQAAHLWSMESGRPASAGSLRKLYERQAIPVAQRPVPKQRGSQKRVVTDQLKEQVAFILADPDIPLEMKSLRKIRHVLPDGPCVSTSSMLSIFRELKKDKLLPKPAKPPRRRSASKAPSGDAVAAAAAARAPSLPSPD